MIVNLCRALLMLLLVAASMPLAAAGDEFPFGTTLMLDAAPMRGSKRIPMLEIAEDGAASIDLWCASARAQVVVSDHSMSISPGDLQNAQCDPDRQSRDAELLAALAQVTNWRRKRGGGRVLRRNVVTFSPDDELTSAAQKFLAGHDRG